MKYSL